MSTTRKLKNRNSSQSYTEEPSSEAPSTPTSLKFATFFSDLSLLSSQFRNYKVIYRRYAGLFFLICLDISDNELVHLEVAFSALIHVILTPMTFS